MPETQNSDPGVFASLKSEGLDDFYFVAIALILAFGTLQVTGSVFQTDKPVVTVVSCSMYPQLHVGDVLVVKGVEYSNINEGDVVVYSTPEMSIPVVHRVIEKNSEYLETKGDNNRGQLGFEKNVEPEQIHGKLMFTVPRVGLVKLLTIDIIGFGKNKPLVLDNTPRCFMQVPVDEREY